jgi:hypothetical protein
MSFGDKKQRGKLHTAWSHTWRAGLLIFCALFVLLFVVTLPPRNSPLGKLDLEEPVGVFTGVKLSRVRENPALCREVIDSSRLKVDRKADERGGLCNLVNGVSMDVAYFPYSTPATVSCPTAAAVYIWEREVVAAAAAKYLPAAVTRIEVVGSYSCRRRYGREVGPISEHASGNAIDISGFRLANGETVAVKTAWKGGGANQQFIHAVRDGACGVFQTVLSPDYNAAHHDHLHLDMGASKICH